MEALKEQITENGIDYILVGDYDIPDLKLTEEWLDLIIEQMEDAEGVTEELQNQLEWVRRMNNIRNQAEENIRSKLIYTM